MHSSQPKTAIPSANWQEYGLWLRRQRRRFRVVEQSMQPTLQPGDTVLTTVGLDRAVQVGDILVVHYPGRTDQLLIKRVQETFYDDSCYLISDNVAEPTARDSRSFGVVSREQILGRVTSLL